MGLADRLGQAGLEARGSSRSAANGHLTEYRVDNSELKREVQETLMDSMGSELFSGVVDAATLEKVVFEAIQTVLSRNPRPLSGGDRACRQGSDEHPDQRWHRLGQDDHPERAVLVHP